MKKFLIVAFVCFVLHSSLAAQTRPQLDPTPYFVGITVQNLEHSAAWYKDVFNLDQADQFEMQDHGVKGVVLESKDKKAVVELVEFKNRITPAEALHGKHQHKITGFMKTGMAVTAFDAWVKFLRDKQVKFVIQPIRDQKRGIRNFIVEDPDGNMIQFFER